MKPLRISDGSLDALKWIALLLMMGDHVNKGVAPTLVSPAAIW
jgi:hypothetical protein